MRGKPGEHAGDPEDPARGKSDPFDVKLVREIIKVEVGEFAQAGRRLSAISASPVHREDHRRSEDELRQAEQGYGKDKLKGYVLDLRDNPGGLLDQAVGVSDLFLEGGEVVSQRGRDPRRRGALQRPAGRHHRRHADGRADRSARPRPPRSSPAPCRTTSAPRSSARTSFGKGSVQTVIPLRGGMDGR